eukprot:4046598-Amphidinium_carterae.1
MLAQYSGTENHSEDKPHMKQQAVLVAQTALETHGTSQQVNATSRCVNRLDCACLQHKASAKNAQ